jgi:hypothetical protein
LLLALRIVVVVEEVLYLVEVLHNLLFGEEVEDFVDPLRGCLALVMAYNSLEV